MAALFKSSIILFVLTLNGCGESKKEIEPLFDNNEDYSVSVNIVEYEGIIPCADCEGIKMTLKIADDFQSYELIEEYLGKDDNVFKESGSVNTERGFEEDLNATVYVLNFDKPETEQRYFVRLSLDSTRLLMLDKNRELIKSELNYSLVRK